MDAEQETAEYVKRFEKEMAELYAQGKVNGPMHLSGGNEKQLINIFKNIKPNDWVCTTYRSHYHALLRGMPADWLKQEIIAGNSMHIASAKYKIITSAIVGGILPIALGIAMGLKLQNSADRVWAFCGDMGAETGTFHECIKYARRHNLPITFVVEDNGVSVDTPTQQVWGTENGPDNIVRHKYNNLYPHQGTDPKNMGF